MAIIVTGYTRYGPLPVPGVYTFVLSQEADASSACSTTPNTTFYSASPTLSVGSFLYSDVELTVPAPNFFWYSNGTTAFRVSGGAGEITSSEACTTTTTTSTTTTTTTGAATTTSTTTTTTTVCNFYYSNIYDDTCTLVYSNVVVSPNNIPTLNYYYRGSGLGSGTIVQFLTQTCNSATYFTTVTEPGSFSCPPA